jgi:hypothetical protein
MAQSKFRLYKYIIAAGSWRDCKATFYSNGKIKPNRCFVGGKEEEPQQAWRQAILRLVDTIVGIAVGIASAWIGLKLATRIPNQTSSSVAQMHEKSIRPGLQ